jgi:hypothetical protein
VRTGRIDAAVPALSGTTSSQRGSIPRTSLGLRSTRQRADHTAVVRLWSTHARALTALIKPVGVRPIGSDTPHACRERWIPTNGLANRYARLHRSLPVADSW